MNKKFFFFLLAPAFIAFACAKSNNADKNITKRIQYDVVIEKPQPDYDWWVQNIDGQMRELTLKNIMQQALDGNVKIYDFFSYKPIKPADLKKIIREVDTISVESPEPPHNLVDSVMVKELKISDIKKLRFLEEWYMNEKTLVFTKKVLAICPMVEKHDEKGEIFGYQPLFWVFFDKKYPKEFTMSESLN